MDKQNFDPLTTFNRSKKVIEPLNGHSSSQNPAVDMIRNKIDALYGEEENSTTEVNHSHNTYRSKHQQYMLNLSESGKPLAEIQAAWHNYYVELSDAEKNEVWREFYEEHERQDSKKVEVYNASQDAPVKESVSSNQNSHRKKHTDTRSISEIKNQITHKVRKKAQTKHSHFHSLLFGLSMGTIVVIVMLFSFFNERIIAPFITPSRTVSSTPIISDLGTTAVSKESKIIIPKINVEIPVVYDEPSVQEEAVQKALERGVLHYATTPNPGEKGNAVIFGHSSNNILNSGKYKFAFVLLSRLEENDTFMLEKGGKRFVYKVFEKKVTSPTDFSVLESHNGKSTVTLITCDPPGTSINRLVVVGEQISPDPNNNVASSVQGDIASQVTKQLPSNSPSLWSRFTNWF